MSDGGSVANVADWVGMKDRSGNNGIFYESGTLILQLLLLWFCSDGHPIEGHKNGNK